MKEIALALLQEKLDKNVIDGRVLDRIIFEKANKLDKNIKYEFRNYLLIFGLINRYKSPEIQQNDAFVIEIKAIKKMFGVEK